MVNRPVNTPQFAPVSVGLSYLARSVSPAGNCALAPPPSLSRPSRPPEPLILVRIPAEDLHQDSTLMHAKPVLFVRANAEGLHVGGLATVRQGP